MSLPIKEFLGQSKLFELDILDLPDSVEHSLYYRYVVLQRAWHGKGTGDINSDVLTQAARSTEAYSDLMQGLLYGMLSDPLHSFNFFQLAHSCVNDGWAVLTEQLKYFTFTRYSDLKSQSRQLLFWLVDRLISLKAKGCEGLILGFLRQIKAGDRSPDNIWTCNSILRILKDHESTIIDMNPIIPYVLFVFLRVLSEDFLSSDLQLQAMDICLNLLYQKYRECSVLGRELARCLLEVSQYSRIQEFWKWLLRPTKEGAAPIVRLLLTPTPRKFLAMRLTPMAESDIQFLLEHTMTSQQNFFLPLFTLSNLCVGEQHDCGALIVDIVRYTVVSQHPSNSVLASPTLQRWSLVTTLLRSITTSYCAASAKLALLFEWLFFNPEVDSIMCIEVGLLVMAKAVVGQPNITATLLEFLLLLRSSFYPPLFTEFARCMDRAIAESISKGVISSLEGFLSTPMLSEQVKTIVISLFPSSIPASRALAEPPDLVIKSLKKVESSLGTVVTAPQAESLIKTWLETIQLVSKVDPANSSDVENLKILISKKLVEIISKSDFEAASKVWAEALAKLLPGIQDTSTGLEPLIALVSNWNLEQVVLKYVANPSEPLKETERKLIALKFTEILDRLVRKNSICPSQDYPSLLLLASDTSVDPKQVANFLAKYVLIMSLNDFDRALLNPILHSKRLFRYTLLILEDALEGTESSSPPQHNELTRMATFTELLALIVDSTDAPLLITFSLRLASLLSIETSTFFRGCIFFILKSRSISPNNLSLLSNSNSVLHHHNDMNLSRNSN